MTKNKSKETFSLKSLTTRRGAIALGIGLATALALTSVALALFSAGYGQRIYPNTYIGSVNYGGKTVAEAEAQIAAQVASFPEELTISIDGKPQASLAHRDIDLHYDSSETAKGLYTIGRNAAPLARLSALVHSLASTNHGTAVYSINQSKTAKLLNVIEQKNGTPAVDAQITLGDDGTPKVTAAKEGKGISATELTQALKQSLGQMKPTLSVASGLLKPNVRDDQAANALTEVQTILAKAPVTFTAGDVKATADPKTVFSWITYSLKPVKQVSPSVSPSPSPTPSTPVTWFTQKVEAAGKTVLVAEINSESLKKYLSTLAESVNSEAKNAELRVADGKVQIVQESVDGKKVKLDEAVAQTMNQLVSSDATPNLAIVVPVDTIAATVKSSTIESLGIKELIGSATTDFKGSPSNRAHNIATGASFLNGELIPPGQEFSTVKTLGQVDGSTGYLPELVIKENRTLPEFGGGLCQVSTTLFRSVLNAGLKVTERQNHSYRVSYYEPPVGLDATIYLPRPDFRFLNDTPGYILVQNKIQGTKITFELYGTKDGRSSAITDPVVSDITAPPPPLYTDTDTLNKGETKQLEHEHPGATAVATYTVTRDGKEINKQTFRSVYKPWQAQFLVGTKEQ